MDIYKKEKLAKIFKRASNWCLYSTGAFVAAAVAFFVSGHTDVAPVIASGAVLCPILGWACDEMAFQFKNSSRMKEPQSRQSPSKTGVADQHP